MHPVSFSLESSLHPTREGPAAPLLPDDPEKSERTRTRMRTFSDYKTAMNDFGGLGGEHVESLLEGSLDADPMFRGFLARPRALVIEPVKSDRARQVLMLAQAAPLPSFSYAHATQGANRVSPSI